MQHAQWSPPRNLERGPIGMHGLLWCKCHAACVFKSVPTLKAIMSPECCNSIACTTGHPSRLADDSMKTEGGQEMLSNPRAALDWAGDPCRAPQ